MGALINSAPIRTRQPQQGTRIRRGNPLAKGLVFAVTGTNGFFDYVSRTFPNNKSGSNVVNCAGGRAAAPAASNGQITWAAGSTGLDKLTGPGTVLMCFRGNNNAANWRAFGSGEDSSTGDGVYLLYDDANNASNGFNAGGNNNNYRANSNSGALGTNSEQSFHAFGFSWDGAAIQMWADGRLDRTVTGGNAAFTPNSNSGRITRLESRTVSSDFLWAFAWNRVLSVDEISDITANPWQIFGGVSEPIYADILGGGTPGEATPAGVSATASIGSVLASGAANAVPAGVTATASIGTAVAGGVANVVVSGVAASAAVGATAATGAATASPSGVSATSAIGDVVASAGGSANAVPAGVQTAASIGEVVATGGATASPAGVAAGSVVGSVIATGAATASLVGVSANAGLGVVVASGGGAIPVAAIDYDRWLLAEAESRLLVLAGEARVLVVEKENRLLIVEAA